MVAGSITLPAAHALRSQHLRGRLLDQPGEGKVERVDRRMRDVFEQAQLLHFEADLAPLGRELIASDVQQRIEPTQHRHQLMIYAVQLRFDAGEPRLVHVITAHCAYPRR
jgi:hypothetical protein